MKRRLSIIIALVALQITGCDKDSDQTDVVFLNGTVLTIDDQNRVAQAIAIKDNVIVAVGSNDEVSALMSQKTDVIDLQGKTLMPAFVAVHEHPAISSVFYKFIDLSGFTHSSDKAVWAALEEAVQATPKGEWIYAMGLDPLLVKDLVLPTRTFLDELAPDNPVFIVSQSLHSFWANSLGFEMRKISRDTPDPGHGSYYEKDKNGELTGFISESAAAEPFLEDEKSPLNVMSNYSEVLKGFISEGYTSVASLGYNLPPLAAKFAGNYWFDPHIRQFFYMKEGEFKYLPDSPQNGDDFFQILGVKLWHDGSPYTGTMYLESPYLTNSKTKMMGILAGEKGGPLLADDVFEQQVTEFHSQGWQIAIHSQGDASSRSVIRQLTRIIKDETDQRHRLEHSLLLPESQLEDMKMLGLTSSFHINHILYYGDDLENTLLGAQRAQRLLPVGSAQQTGLKPTLHADSPMFPPSAFSLMRTAIQRQTMTGKPLNPTQSVSKSDALRLMTINGAWQLHMEDKLGSIEAGKLADFIVLSHNPLETEVERWPQIQVEQTWMDGERKY